VVPTLAFALLFADEWRRFGVQTALAAFFSLAGGDGEELATTFFTLPTFSAILYSVGAALRAVR
jgi:hypothetical protein